MMNVRDPWDLIFDGEYEKALPLILEDDYSQGHNPGLLYLALNRLGEAETSFTKAPEDTSARGEMLGTCFWLQEHRKDALEQWKIAQKALYQDAAGGVIPRALRFYAAVRMQDIVEQELALEELNNLSKSGISVWPAPIAGFLAGEFPEDEFTWSECNSPVELKEAREVQINFWKGVMRLLKGDWVESKRFFSKAYRPSGRGILEAEHFLAKYELEKASQGETR